MQLRLERRQAEALLELARAQAPREACGLLGCVDGRVASVVAIDNVAAEPTQRFELDARQYTQALFAMQRDGLELCGIWHSHPQGEPLPSAEDIRGAAWPEVCHLLIGLGAGRAQLAAWRIAGGEVTRVPLQIGDQVPDIAPGKESRTERRTIWLSAVAATLLLLWLALSLLPPAPSLP